MAEKAFEFKSQCETSDLMLREYLAMMHNSAGPPLSYKPEGTVKNGECNVVSVPPASQPPVPVKRKRGRPRKEENLIFYNSPVSTDLEKEAPPPAPVPTADTIQLVDGVQSLVTVVDPRSDFLSNSDEELKEPVLEEEPSPEAVTARSLAIARAKAKKYMGIIMEENELGVKLRRHLCKVCMKTFAHRSDLKKHVLVHTGRK